MEKIKLVDALKTTTMFLIDHSIEERLEKEIMATIKEYRTKMSCITDMNGLAKFIKSERESISMLETLLGISGEKIKRVVTMLRVMKGYTFDTEWDERRIQKELASNETLMTEFCELFINGKNMPKFQALIPNFILQDFKIDVDTIGRLSSEEFMRSLIKARMIAGYSSQYAQVYDKLIKNGLESFALNEGLELQQQVFSNTTIPCYIIADNRKRIIFTYSFQSTTSNNQNKFADNHVAPIYEASRTEEHTLVVNILDGAGWIGRSTAYKKIYHDCDYFLNLQNIGQVKQIIDYFFNNIS